jgi:nitrate ABC transporter ATP-binding subunit
MNPAVDRYLELWNVNKAYPGLLGPITIVRDFNLIMRQGEFVSIIGHSGCGKSTILSIVAGLNELTSGGVVLAGREIDGAGPDRGVVFQSPSLLPWLTAFGNVLLGVEQVQPDLSRSARSQLVEHYLTLVGLGDSQHKRPAELSQGMRQRVGLARAFALNPKMLLLDEPFGMLDSLTRFELQQVLIDLWSQDQKTALMVTHDVDEALFLSDRIVMMTNGPEARVGDILTVPFARPRNRSELLEDPGYYRLREQLVSFLEAQHGPPVDHSAAAHSHPPLSGQLQDDAPKPELQLVRCLAAVAAIGPASDGPAVSSRTGRASELCRITLR